MYTCLQSHKSQIMQILNNLLVKKPTKPKIIFMYTKNPFVILKGLMHFYDQ